MEKVKDETKDIRRSSPRTEIFGNIDWDKAAELFSKLPVATPTTSNFPRVKEILRLLAVAGKVGIVLAFPGAARGLKPILIGNQSYRPWKFKKILSQLSRQQMVSISEDASGTVNVKISEKGIARTLSNQLDALQLPKPKLWDKKWRVVIFDVPERHKRLRDVFRKRLKQLELYQLQKSVFVSPYPCFDEIEFLRELYAVRLNVRYLLVERIEEDDYLRNHFRL